MMPLTDKKRTLSPFIIFLLIILPLFAGLYYLDPQSNTGFTRMRDRQNVGLFTLRSHIHGNTVFLAREQALVLNRCKLVFRGVKERGIQIDLFLLELDPDYAYPQFLSKKKAKAGFTMAEMDFRLRSVNKNRLKLEIRSNLRSE